MFPWVQLLWDSLSFLDFLEVYFLCQIREVLLHYIFFFLFKYFIYLFLEKGREGEREGEKHQCVVASHMAPTGDLACNPGMWPDWELN